MAGDVIWVVVLGSLAILLWGVIPMYLRIRYQVRSGLLMELLIVTYWLARVLRIPVD